MSLASRFKQRRLHRLVERDARRLDAAVGDLRTGRSSPWVALTNVPSHARKDIMEKSVFNYLQRDWLELINGLSLSPADKESITDEPYHELLSHMSAAIADAYVKEHTYTELVRHALTITSFYDYRAFTDSP